jgi:hypothetical protein
VAAELIPEDAVGGSQSFSEECSSTKMASREKRGAGDVAEPSSKKGKNRYSVGDGGLREAKANEFVIQCFEMSGVERRAFANFLCRRRGGRAVAICDLLLVRNPGALQKIGEVAPFGSLVFANLLVLLLGYLLKDDHVFALNGELLLKLFNKEVEDGSVDFLSFVRDRSGSDELVTCGTMFNDYFVEDAVKRVIGRG